MKSNIQNIITDKKSHVSINQLSEETGADRRSIKKWLAADGLAPVGGLYDQKAATGIIRQHQESASEDVSESARGGATYAEKLKQEVIKLERENRIAAKLEDETYMLTEDVEKMMLMGMSKIENIPSKIESEFGLPQNVIKRLTNLLDEARTEWAKGLKGLQK